MKKVTVVVSAGGASERMLRACLCSLERHRGKTEFDVLVVCPAHQSSVTSLVTSQMGIKGWAVVIDTPDHLSGSRMHAMVLDAALRTVKTPYMLTLDADCFPVTDDWLDVLMEEIDDGAAVTGILHPYGPPPEDLGKETLEFRIRSQLCWNNTHVACQLISMNVLKKLGVTFSHGDDTGLAIPKAAREAGLKVTGLKVTGCARPTEDVDLEYNREHCLIFGDRIYHHGGGAREEQDRGSPSDVWRLVRKQVLDEGGAEFVLKDMYRFKFDHEETIASQMANRIMRGMRIYLETHDRALEE